MAFKLESMDWLRRLRCANTSTFALIFLLSLVLVVLIASSKEDELMSKAQSVDEIESTSPTGKQATKSTDTSIVMLIFERLTFLGGLHRETSFVMTILSRHPKRTSTITSFI